MSNDIERHYAGSGIAQRVLAAVRATLPEGAPLTVDALAAVDHFHGRGLAATREMAAALGAKPGERILDIGCGIGGPARWIATHSGAEVTGIDLTPDFTQAAEILNEATGLGNRVRIVCGSALELPFDDANFDRAYSQNVVMNIADKARFYAEARRVLKPGGILVLSNIARGTGAEPVYPTPWAATAATSFLSTPQETRRDVEAAGLAICSFRDTTADGRAMQDAMARRLATDGLPKLGAHLILGERMREYQLNSIRNTSEGRTLTLEIVAKRPA